MTDDDQRAQAEGVRAEAERLYVHDPATVRHPSWAEFNRFLREVLDLCKTVIAPDRPNPYLWTETELEDLGVPPRPDTGDLVHVVDPDWNCRQVPLAADVTGPFYFDRHATQWVVFTRFPIPAAHAQRYKSRATAYPVPQEDQ